MTDPIDNKGSNQQVTVKNFYYNVKKVHIGTENSMQ